MSTATLEIEECKVVKLDDRDRVGILDTRDRCDHSATVGSEYSANGKTGISCGSQSYVRVTLRSGAGELYFCKHHADKVEPSLKPLASEWYTEESRLREDRKKGSEN